MTSQSWKYIGCGNDTYGANALPTKIADTKDMTVETCIKQCSGGGYKYAGLEYSSQCFCGNSLPQSATPMTDSIGDCHMPCSGNSSETCGDSAKLSLYQSCAGGDCKNAFVGFIGEIGDLADNALGAVSGSGSSASSSSPSKATSAAAASSTAANSAKPASASNAAIASAPAPSASVAAKANVASPASPSSASPSGASTASSSSSSGASLPAGWTAAGCYSDALGSRALSGITFASINAPLTTANCAAYCAKNGYSMAGTEYGAQCFCGNELNGSTKEADSDCKMACEGDSAQMCGGSLRLNVVSSKAVKRRSAIKDLV